MPFIAAAIAAASVYAAHHTPYGPMQVYLYLDKAGKLHGSGVNQTHVITDFLKWIKSKNFNEKRGMHVISVFRRAGFDFVEFKDIEKAIK